MNLIRKIMKNWQLNLLITAYASVSCTRFLTVRTISSDDSGLYKDLMLVSITAILGEFIVVGSVYIYQCLVSPDRTMSESIQFMQFVVPAACDFTRMMIYIFSLAALSTVMLDCVTAVSLGVGLVMTAVLCKYVLASWNQLFSFTLIMISLTGLGWLLFVDYTDLEPDYGGI